MVEKASFPMEYRYLGNSGLKVSAIAYGDMISQETEEYQQKTQEIINKCFEAGVNFFDSAEFYGENGAHEKVLGKALKASGKQRSEYVVTTKLYFTDIKALVHKPNASGLSRKHLLEGLNKSLTRLQLDYVDIVYCSRPDPTVPMDEVVLSMKHLMEKNKTLYWATSEWSAAEIIHAYWMCEKYGVPKPIAEQVQYNMLLRDRFEVEHAYLFDKYNLGTTTWGTLSGGLLTGKLLDESFDRKGTRYEGPFNDHIYQFARYLGPDNIESTKKMFAGLAEVGNEFGLTTAELAIAWALKNKNVSTAVLGLSKPSHLESALKPVRAYTKLTKEHEEKIDSILKTAPDYGINWKTFSEKTPRRYKFY